MHPNIKTHIAQKFYSEVEKKLEGSGVTIGDDCQELFSSVILLEFKNKSGKIIYSSFNPENGNIALADVNCHYSKLGKVTIEQSGENVSKVVLQRPQLVYNGMFVGTVSDKCSEQELKELDTEGHFNYNDLELFFKLVEVSENI